MIYLKTPEEIEKMQAACTLVSRTLGEVAKCGSRRDYPPS